MVFEQIEQLRRKYTDKWVVVDDSQPELRRFRGATGIVKTVNMSGRALVEFDLYENIGWFDIDPDFLKVVERPADQVEPTAEKAAAKPAAAKPVPTKAPIAKKAPAQATAPQDGPTRPPPLLPKRPKRKGLHLRPLPRLLRRRKANRQRPPLPTHPRRSYRRMWRGSLSGAVGMMDNAKRRNESHLPTPYPTPRASLASHP